MQMHTKTMHEMCFKCEKKKKKRGTKYITIVIKR